MASKPMDLSKFRKSLTKSIEGLSIGFNDPTDWVSTGNYALNYLISGDFNGGIPLGKVTMFAGESGCLPASATVRIKQNGDISEITVAELKKLYDSNPESFEIDTPDDFQRIGQWFDKGVLPMVRIETPSFTTICADNHLLQLENDEWLPAAELTNEHRVITRNGIESVTTVINVDDEECYDFEVLHPNHRYWGDGISSHNSGKSYICSGNVVKNAQEQGIFVVLIDTENALDEAWLQALGVDTSEDKLLKLNMAMIDDVAKTISEFMKEYRDMTDKPKVLFVIDSLGMLLTPTDVDQFDKGDMKGDMGRKPKALAQLIRNCVNMFGSYNVGMLVTNHTYKSQNIYDPDDKISGGSLFVFASSIVIAMNKSKLKEDEDGNKITTVNGINSKCNVIKSRYAKPFEKIEVKIPYNTGMSPYSGLTDLFENQGLLKKSGNSLEYISPDGEIIKKFRKAWEKNDSGCLDTILENFHQHMEKVQVLETEEEELLDENE